MNKSPKHKKTADYGPYQVGRSLPTGSPKANSVTNKNYKKTSKKSHKKRIVTILTLLFIILSIMFGLFAWNKVNGIFKGSLLDLFAKNEPLARDKFGRSNILVFGTSEDDEGHSGATLADSIMVISINQDTYDANMLSVPRDLWVKFNSDCSLGSEQKLNVAYECALQHYDRNEAKASIAFASQISEIIGTDIQYYAKVDYTVVKNVVNSLGGIDVTINSSDPRGIFDPATKIKFSNGVHHIDGQTALELSRSRGAFGGYGLSKSNFDRERNQQMIAQAILAKATSTGTLANPAKVLSVFGSLGDNITTNIETKNIKTIVSVANNVKPEQIVSLPLDDKEKPLVTTGMYRGLSIVKPTAGVFNYSQIQEYVAKAFAKTTPKDNSNKK